ncbi:hypothetical protein L195_g011638 [Trifolium pratense]|uniref:RNase H type-1 domain-containing protein n=1 Tax=Trifolium pratense TaxID=57577 RepID=A0A2K3PI30_TRIPR|nr:hypothetical protein L195_g023955 [Trifolium pratense]PNY14949.1 hypothetical protein L195_g011638 [Trifolium pratense]
MGACFRDHVGNFVAGFTQRQRATLSTVEGEAWALLQAMKKANYRGLDRVQFESNSQVLTEAIRTKRSGNSEFSLVAADIIQIMLLCINFEVKFVRDKRIWLLILLLGRPILVLVSVDLRLFLYVLNIY